MRKYNHQKGAIIIKLKTFIIVAAIAALSLQGVPLGATETAPEREIDFSKPMIALTFDDGPSKKTTPTVLAALKKHNVRATFFTVGENAEKNPALLKEIYEAGHEIGNHTYTHPNLKTLSEEKIKDELLKTDKIICEITGYTPLVIRAPGGRVNSSVESADPRPFISWTVDTLDWKHRDTDRIIAFIETAPLKDGDVILMHDIHKTSAAAVDRVIEILKERGFELVTVSELMLFRGE